MFILKNMYIMVSEIRKKELFPSKKLPKKYK